MFCPPKISLLETANTPPPPHPPPASLKNSNALPVVRSLYPIKLCRFIVSDFTWDIAMQKMITRNFARPKEKVI